ncbi:MAG: glycoside hydrolase family 3 C-terminal domain-containing protein, partial [Bacteroidales bacterium]|nr:glycoside hydrolase family 3 C-terminal domain-containing protein [Bacteroidales bacterium]
AQVSYVKGCNVIGEDIDEINRAVKVAKTSDVAIVVLGENEWQKANKSGTSGEGYDVATLELTGRQQELIRRVNETGTRTVVVLINGRPLAIPWIDENVPAIVEAWIPGEKGGAAIAGILFGDFNPSGKLTVTIPRHAGQLPVYYNHKPSKRYWLKEGWGNSYADLDHRPLYPFGYGLSYAQFEYSKLEISPEQSGPFGTFRIRAEITNTSDVPGSEIVQLYIRDKISSVVRPVKELKGFERISLEPGESKLVHFELGYDQLKMLNRDLNWTVEPGEFTMMVGSSSEDIRLTGSLRID